MERAANEFLDYLREEGFNLDIDDFSKESLEIFRRQEKEYQDKGGFRLFSMLTLAFLQMGIIEL